MGRVLVSTSCRFESQEVYLRRHPVDQNLDLSRRSESWDKFFELMKSIDVPDDFLADRADSPQQKLGRVTPIPSQSRLTVLRAPSSHN